MTYRNYLGFISKQEYEKIKKLSVKEHYEYQGHYFGYEELCIYHFPPTVKHTIFEFNPNFKLPKNLQSPFFLDKKSQKYFSPGIGLAEAYLMDKNSLKKIIESKYKLREYEVIELLHIYKTFDWENEIMFYYGYF